MLNDSVYCGCCCWLHTQGGGAPEADKNNMAKNAVASATIWIPNFNAPYLGMPSTLAEKLATVVAYSMYRRGRSH